MSIKFRNSETFYKSMRKTILIAFAALATSLVASAGTLTSNCTLFPVQFPGGNQQTPQTVTCPGLNVAGATLNSVTLGYSVDYQFATVIPASVSVTFTPATFGVPGVTWQGATTVVASSGGASSGGIQTGSAFAATGVTAANFANNFTVQVASAVTAGAVATSSGAVQVTYDYTVAPEPATLSMIGLSLVGLGVVARRRTAK
jgi:PEP-CTERM motif